MAELTLKQKKAIALAKARRAKAQQGSDSPAFLNRGIATVLGAPVDIANAGLGLIGLGTEQPFGGSASLEQGMRSISPEMVPAENEEADSMADYIFQGTGEAAGAILPMFSGAKAMSSAANPVVSGVGRSMTAAPVSGAAIETASGAGAGAGKFLGEQAAPEGEEDLYGMAGELAGGLSVGGAVAAPKIVAKGLESLPLTGTAIRAARGVGGQVAGAVLPSTPAGARQRASDRVRSLVAEPDTEADKVRNAGESSLTPAQRTGNPRLMALERAIGESSPEIEQSLSQQRRDAYENLESDLREVAPGNSRDTRKYLEERVGGLRDQIALQVETAKNRAEQRLVDMQPQTARAEAPRVLREEFDAAYEAARQQETELWENVPKDVEVDTGVVFDAYDEIVETTPRTQRDQIPDFAKKFFDRKSNERLSDKETPAELQGARSQLLEIEREARAAGKRNTARLAEKMQQALLDAMDQTDVVSAPYQAARDYSRMVNETFRRGQIGQLSKVDRTGAMAVPVEMTAEATIGRGRERGDIARRELTEAQAFAGRDPEPTNNAVQDHIRQSFLDTATGSGDFSRASANRFLINNDALLRQYPEIREDIGRVISDQSRAAYMKKAGPRRISDLERKSAASRYLSGDVNNEIQKVFRSQDPQGQARSSVQTVSKDPSGKALAGLKSSVVDNLIESSRRNTPDGSVLRGSEIAAALDGNRAAISEILTGDEIARLERIAGDLVNLERSEGRLPSVGGVMNDLPNELLSYAARIAGARAGAELGGGSMAGGLQSAQMMSGRAKRFMQRLTNDRAAQLLSEAVNDPELYAALLSPMNTPDQAREASSRLNAWLVGPGVGFLEEGEDQDPLANLSREDIASPVASEDIAEGRRIIEGAEADRQSARLLSSAGIPEINTEVDIFAPNGMNASGTVIGATDQDGEVWVSIRMSDGSLLEQPSHVLRGAVFRRRDEPEPQRQLRAKMRARHQGNR